MPPQLAAPAAAGRARANPRTIAINRTARMLLISHSRAVSARVCAAPQGAILQYGDGVGVALLREPVGYGQDVVAAAPQLFAHGNWDAALEPQQVRRVARVEASQEEARPLDRLVDLHAVVERVGEDLGVEQRLPVAPNVGEPQHGPLPACHDAGDERVEGVLARTEAVRV